MKNYVKEYKGHKVPEGATHYGAETEAYYEGFYKKGSHRIAKSNCWVGTSGRIPDHAIELPLAKEEFIPAVGEWFISSDGEKLFYVGADHTGSILCCTKDQHLRFLIDIDGCKPVQSERDIAIERLIELCMVDGEISNTEFSHDELAGTVYDYFQSLK